MYIPAHFAADEPAVDDLLTHHGAADLITATPQGVVATMLPFVYDPGMRTFVVISPATMTSGGARWLARLWSSCGDQMRTSLRTSMGRLAVHDDLVWVEQNVRDLTGRHEAGRPQPWSVDDAPSQFIEGQLRAIVGVELLITRIEASFKLSQNRSAADVDGVISGLTSTGHEHAAQAVQRARTA
jgi:transcriptional regulator